MRNTKSTFIDLFAGCGGFSLGLMQAGWQGLFAVEKDPHAFATLEHNFLREESEHKFDWPKWLEKKPRTVSSLIRRHSDKLKGLRGSVDLIVGGPPCQGFSLVGVRKINDPRNKLYNDYLKIVKLIHPKFIVLENVKGITISFKRKRKNSGKLLTRKRSPVSEVISRRLQALGYNSATRLVYSRDFGVPQLRPRFILIAWKSQIIREESDWSPFDVLEQTRQKVLKEKGLFDKLPVSVKEAISDLTVRGKKLSNSTDTRGFQQINYKGPKTNFQRLLHANMNGTAPNSLRLPKHSKKISKRFQKIISSCRPGISLSRSEKKAFGIKKHCLVVLNRNRPSHTLTTLPDDIIHFSEPRILTVRECARLQSFPDSFEFKGKYTTGGKLRVIECPRYTQVGNAVPPFLSETVGRSLIGTITKNKR